MKHTLKVTLLLVSLFLVSQLVGLAVVRQYIDVSQYKIFDEKTGSTIIVRNMSYSALPYNIERPEVQGTAGFVYILLAVLIGTAIFFLIMRLRKRVLWKFWFYFAVVLCLSIAMAPFITPIAAFIISMVLGYYKVFRPKIVVHNVTELIVYGGLAAIFVPVLSLMSVFLLMAAISVYDMIAVWYSGHMIRMAKFQAKEKVFAGLLLPYKRIKAVKAGVGRRIRVHSAILGGGDIGFPLIFAGVVMKGLLLENPASGFYKAMIIPLFAAAALFILFLKSEKGKFYPAMPFLSIGCIAGWLITLI